MALPSPSALFTAILEPRPLVILSTLAVALLLPVLLHLILYRSSSSVSLPSFLLTGPSGAGKTSLMLRLERGQNVATYTSQAPQFIETSLPVGAKAASDQYRSSNDPSFQTHKRFLVVDTPGHGKLRHHAIDQIVDPQNLRGIIFVVDAADLSLDSKGLRDAAEYLHEILLSLQRRLTRSKTSKAPKHLPMLIAANKVDLFTALPVSLVKSRLEQEITQVRSSRAKGLFDSGVGMNEFSSDTDKDWLGETEDGGFEFSQMEEANVEIQIESGSVIGTEKPDISGYWDWLGKNL